MYIEEPKVGVGGIGLVEASKVVVERGTCQITSSTFIATRGKFAVLFT